MKIVKMKKGEERQYSSMSAANRFIKTYTKRFGNTGHGFAINQIDEGVYFAIKC